MRAFHRKRQLELDRAASLHSLVKLFDPYPKRVTIRQYGTTNRVLCVLAQSEYLPDITDSDESLGALNIAE